MRRNKQPCWTPTPASVAPIQSPEIPKRFVRRDLSAGVLGNLVPDLERLVEVGNRLKFLRLLSQDHPSLEPEIADLHKELLRGLDIFGSHFEDRGETCTHCKTPPPEYRRPEPWRCGCRP